MNNEMLKSQGSPMCRSHSRLCCALFRVFDWANQEQALDRSVLDFNLQVFTAAWPAASCQVDGNDGNVIKMIKQTDVTGARGLFTEQTRLSSVTAFSDF